MVGDYLFDSTLNGVMDSADYVTDVLLNRSLVEGQPKPTRVSHDYFEFYDGNKSYEQSFHEVLRRHAPVDLIREVWKRKPPYRLLDVGSASGLTLKEFQELGVEAWGIENNAHIHRRTPVALRLCNLLGTSAHFPSRQISSISPTRPVFAICHRETSSRRSGSCTEW